MISEPDVEAVIGEAYQRLLTRQPGLTEAVVQYNQRGGEGAWVAFGLLVHVSDADRLVLEALYLKQHEGCVVRVYNEESLTFHYARKNRESAVGCGSLVTEALEVFQLHMPKKLLPAKYFAPPPELAHIGHSLMPIPPPLGACEVPD
jgi:hypothetical protein